MMRVIFVLLLICVGGNKLLAQEHVLWKGKVLDHGTRKPIEGVHIKSSNQQGVTDRDGYFSIPVKVGDHITITHVSYQTYEYQIRDGILLKEILLRVLEQELEEVTVRSLPSEEELKQLLLNTNYIPTPEETYLQQNVNYMKTIHRLNNNHYLNAFDYTLKKLNSGNGEATIFSSNPSMGILGLIRSFRKPGAMPFDKPRQYLYPPSFRFRGDTTTRYSDYFDQ